MKKLVTLLMLQTIALSIVANSRTIEQPNFMSLSADGITIERIEFAKRSTILTFCAIGKEGCSVGFSPSVCLVDEEGHRYPARSSKGLKLGKLERIGKDGSLKFSISFEPLPEGTRVFDCLESPDANLHKRFYAIRPQGQEWDVFAKKTVQDVPFPNSAFRVDTVLVTGRIVSGEYNRLRQRPVHLISSNSQNALLRNFRDNRGVFDFLYVKKNGEFSFKTVVRQPTIDILNLYGILVPVLLIPGDHVKIEISDLGEFGQQVNYNSNYGDYGKLLTNIPFLFERELNESSYLKNGMKLPAQTWFSLHTAQKNKMEICDYISAKYGFTETETAYMQAVAQTSGALVSVMRMLTACSENYYGLREMTSNAAENSKIQKQRTVTEWEKSGVSLDFSFLKDVQMDNPATSVSPFYESLIMNTAKLVAYIQFGNVSNISDEMNISDMVGQLGYSKDVALAITAFCLDQKGLSISYPSYYNGDIESLYAAARENRRKELQPLARQIGCPHLKMSVESLVLQNAQPNVDYYSVDDKEILSVVQSFVKSNESKEIVIFPVHEYSSMELKKMEISYRLNCSELRQEYKLVPITTKRYLSKSELRDLQLSCPMLNNTVYLADETYLRFRDVLQFQIHQSNERIFSPDGQTYQNAEKSFFSDIDKKW
ncbi:MAG: hypothetical protein Q4F47_09395 [Bacteroidaceae bacterium]|nr:hypothetical protein [Bacteroidaceae bacterium]